MAIGLSPGGSTIYSFPSPSKELLIATAQGVVIIERDASGPTWHVAHRALTERHISAIIKEPQSGLIFAGAFQGSVSISADGGRTWDLRDNGLSERDVYSLASAQINGKVRVYAGTEPAHLFCSDDLGLHWTELAALRSVPSVPKWTFPGPPHIAHVKDIQFDPYNSTTMYASIEVGVLLKSTDAGKTWQELHGMDADLHRLVIHPHKPEHMCAVTGDGLYVTSDSGASWEHRTSSSSEIGGYPDVMVFHPQQPELMFVGAAQERPRAWNTKHFAGSRISRSRDGGRTWEVLRNGLPDRMQAAIEAMCLEDCGASFSVFAATTAGDVYCSENGGESWTRIISGIPPVAKAGHYRVLAVA